MAVIVGGNPGTEVPPADPPPRDRPSRCSVKPRVEPVGVRITLTQVRLAARFRVGSQHHRSRGRPALPPIGSGRRRRRRTSHTAAPVAVHLHHRDPNARHVKPPAARQPPVGHAQGNQVHDVPPPGEDRRTPLAPRPVPRNHVEPPEHVRVVRRETEVHETRSRMVVVPAVPDSLPPLPDVQRHLQSREAELVRRAGRADLRDVQVVVRRTHVAVARVGIGGEGLVLHVARAVRRRCRHVRHPRLVEVHRRERGRETPVVLQRLDGRDVPAVVVPRVRAVVLREPPERSTGINPVDPAALRLDGHPHREHQHGRDRHPPEQLRIPHHEPPDSTAHRECEPWSCLYS